MTGYVRKDTTNNIADGNVINAADLDAEFDGVQDAFNASTGHNHDGTSGEGAPITALGPTQDVTISAILLAPKTTNTVDIGSSSLRYKDLFLAGNGSIGGTLAVTGVATLTAQPILSSLTASRAVFTDGSKGLVSNAITGTGNVVMSASPTLTGTIDAAAATLSGNLTLSGGTANGVAYLNGSKVVTSGSALTFDGTNFAVGTSSPVANTPLTLQASSGYTDILWLKSVGTNIDARINIAPTGTGVAQLNNTNGTPIAFQISGSEQMRLTSTGLGIGTSSPAVKLALKDTSPQIDFITSAASDISASVYGAVDVGTGGKLVFRTKRNGNTPQDVATLDSSGNLGIGTSSPSYKLDVAGAARSDSWIGRSNTSAPTTDAFIYRPADNTIALGTANTERMRIDASGNLGIGTTSIPTVGSTTVLAVGNANGGTHAIVQSGSIVYRTSASTSSVDFYTGNAVPLIFYTSGSERARIDSSGNLGIGTSSPSYKLDVIGVLGSGNGTITSGFSYDTGGLVGTFSNHALGVLTNGNVVAKFDTSGNLGLGVTPSAWSQGKATEIGQLGNAVWSPAGNEIIVSQGAYYNGGWKYSGSSVGAVSFYSQITGQHQWYTAPSGTAGNAITFTQAMTLDASGRLLVGLTSGTSGYNIEAQSGSAGTGIRASNSGGGFVAIEAESNATSNGVVKWSNDLKFVNSSGSERARIDSSGNLLCGTTSSSNTPSQGITLMQNTNVGSIGIGHANGTSSGNGYMNFAYNGSAIGSITQSGTTAVLYNTTSDQRLKENIQNADSASAIIDALQVRKFDWKSDNSHQRYGFVAQELVTVAPEAVHQPADPDEMMAVDYSKLVPMLVKEIQSLRKRLADANL